MALPPFPASEEHGCSGAGQPRANIYHPVAAWLHQSFTLSDVNLLTCKTEQKCLSHTGELPGPSEQMGKRHLLNVLTRGSNKVGLKLIIASVSVILH